jgi:anaerobic selenocysteine-containing dehydrogenase
LRWVLLAISGSLDTAHGMHFHRGLLFPLRPLRPTPSPPVASRPELRRWIGQDPCVALGDEIGAGHLRALVVAGANPITAFPDPAASRTRLKALETLAVADVIENELTTFATHVLPVAGQLERADVPMHEHVALRGGTCYSPPAVSLAGARRPAWWVFAQLAGHMTGVDLFGRSPDELTDDDVLALIARRSVVPWATIRAAGPHGVAIEPDIGWLRIALLDGEPWRLAPDLLVDRLDRLENPDDGLVLVPRRRMRANNSVADPIDPDREALVLLHPLDGAIAGVVDGGTVALTSRHGRVESTVRFDTGLRRGVVSMSHGDRIRSSGALVSARDEIDDLTGMPRASGIPIKVEAVDR